MSTEVGHCSGAERIEVRLDGSTEMNSKELICLLFRDRQRKSKKAHKDNPEDGKSVFFGGGRLINQRPFLPFDKHEKGWKGISFDDLFYRMDFKIHRVFVKIWQLFIKTWKARGRCGGLPLFIFWKQASLVLTNEYKQRLQIDIFSPEQSTVDLMISSDNYFSFFFWP